ncbi:Outer membrane protein assembly factor BamD [Candidatus Terasakiella magnetica]|uniref:Outer membrane protein assembly factor BamD n=1 Tax=Candidatus Terasakiella magnetica TaxID=1867952 RepID=A0A1C3RJH1_9PROT|nr:outer membrane protein assembly factor BamD [Candidatus Terasakiella magnetica]SCA57401.1 Outer membrane protein assembly factor BamD [Candidatus Terasakiella magnetica]
MKQIKKKTILRLAAPLMMFAALSACSGTDQAEDYQESPVEQLYNDAHNNMLAGEYEEAAKKFDEVERQHPYSIWATKSQLMAAYANYENEEYDEAVIALDRFIQLHPSNKDVPYATYLKGLSYYEQISDVGRDQMMTDLAQKTFRELIKRYPTSKYSRDARLKLDLTFDHLAGKEMEIGRYYTSRNQCIAALSRFKTVVQKYDTTTHVPEALHRMIECYLQLGLDDEARRTAAILGHNFPGSDWYIDSYQIVERKRVKDKEAPSWYWPFEEKDALEVLEEQDGLKAEDARPDEEALEPAKEDKSWYNFWD